MSAMNNTFEQVNNAMSRVARADFLPDHVKHLAAYDGPLTIGENQTNSQPYTVAIMLRLLDVQPGHKVLDVGAGSGWTTALLAHLVGASGQVLGVERHASLLERAQAALAPYNGGQAEIRLATQGVLGWPEGAPFDRILVSAEAKRMPDPLIDQLGDNGVMVIPVAGKMVRVIRRGREIETSTHGFFRFVPLVED